MYSGGIPALQICRRENKYCRKSGNLYGFFPYMKLTLLF